MTNHDTANQDPAKIRSEIERTRAGLGETVSALQIRLDPQRLKRQASDAVREATVGRVENFADDAMESVKGASEDVFETIKRNPLPAAVAAFGLGWLLMESKNSPRAYPRSRYYGGDERLRSFGRDEQARYYAPEEGYRYESWEQRERRAPQQDASQRVREAGRSVGDRASRVAEGAQETVGDLASAAQDTVKNIAGSAQDTAERVATGAREGVEGIAHQAERVATGAREGVESIAHEAQRQASWAGSRFTQMLDTNPLMVGAAAMALGAVIGFGLPKTQREDEFMGEARDSFVEKAQETARDTADRVQHVAEEAANAAKTEAREQKLTA